MHNHKIRDIDPRVYDEVIGKMYFPSTYYNSLDFIYKYIKEVMLKELFGVNKNFFAKIFTNIQEHRFAREAAVRNNNLYNLAYPNLFINLEQDFSGPGRRTTMAQASNLYILDPEVMMKTIFHEHNMIIRLSSAIYKYNINLSFRFDSPLKASNFVSTLYTRVHVNKHYYPDYSLMKYRFDKAIYQTIRAMYKAQIEHDGDFIKYMDDHTNKRFIREYDSMTGNLDYYLLFPIRPLTRIGTPTIMHDNNVGPRETLVNLMLELEVELPNSLYFQASAPVCKELLIYLNGVNINDPTDILPKPDKKDIISSTEIGNVPKPDITVTKDTGQETVYVVKNEDLVSVDPKLVIMPMINDEDVKIDFDEVTSTNVMIDEISDVVCIEDKLIVSSLFNNKNDLYVMKVFDEDGLEIIPREVKLFEQFVDVIFNSPLEDTVIAVKLYKKKIKKNPHE